MKVLSCGMKSPRDCFRCQRADCDCNDSSTTEEGEWMRNARPDKRKVPKRKARSTQYDITPRLVKSNTGRNNYEYLFF